MNFFGDLFIFVLFASWWFTLTKYNPHLSYLYHALSSITLSLFSLSVKTQRVDFEYYVIRNSFGYFWGHGYFMVKERETMYIIHHLLSITLLLGVLVTPSFVTLKASSNVLLTEFSTVFMWISETYPSKTGVLLFVTTYFLSRLLWLGYFNYRVFYSSDSNDIASSLVVGPFHYFCLILFLLNVLYFFLVLIPSVPGTLSKLGKDSKTKV